MAADINIARVVSHNKNVLIVHCQNVLENFKKAGKNQAYQDNLLESLNTLHTQIANIITANGLKDDQETFLIFYTGLFKQLYDENRLPKLSREEAQFAANFHSKIQSVADDPYDVSESLPKDLKEAITDNNQISPYDFVMRSMMASTTILNYLVPAMLLVGEGNALQRFQRSRNYEQIVSNTNPENINVNLVGYFEKSAKVAKFAEIVIPELPKNMGRKYRNLNKNQNYLQIMQRINEYNELLKAILADPEPDFVYKHTKFLNGLLQNITGLVNAWMKIIPDKSSPHYAYANHLLDNLQNELNKTKLYEERESRKSSTSTFTQSSTAKLISSDSTLAESVKASLAPSSSAEPNKEPQNKSVNEEKIGTIKNVTDPDVSQNSSVRKRR